MGIPILLYAFPILYIHQSYGSTEVLRPRGVALIKAALYDASKPFRCFDGSNEVPFAYVNDDYCDCLDGSDEPGTAACAQGFFNCANRGYKPWDIPSSRVNDGVCDCCDGSDEYDDKISCPNTCIEMGKQMREEAHRQLETLKRGYQKRLEYIESVKNKKNEKSAAFETIEKQITELENSKTQLTKLRDDAEEPEKAAIDQHRQAFEAVKKERQEKKERSEAEAVFKELGIGKDILSGAEILNALKREKDSIEAELVEAFSDVSLYNFEEFFTKVWGKVKSWYKELKTGKAPEPVEETTTPPPPIEYDESEHHEADEDTADHFHDEEPEADVEEQKTPKSESDDESMPEYSDEIKQLIEKADKARKDLKDVEERLYQLSAEKTNLRKWLENDYGSDNVFAALEGSCYEYTDREYTYKLCPFDRVTQRPKDGGSETSLGKWGKWEDGYNAMKFDDGARCWNGPSRSTKVRLECGEDHALSSASEPSRCEYEMLFRTPVVCPEPPKEHHVSHDEL